MPTRLRSWTCILCNEVPVRPSPAEGCDNDDAADLPGRPGGATVNSDRRDQLLEALESDGSGGMRDLTQRLLDKDVPTEILLDDLGQIRGLVTEDQEETVLDIMDRLAGWCAPSARMAKRPAEEHGNQPSGSQLLPGFAAWQREFVPEPDERGYLSTHVSLTSAVLFSELMVPRFIRVRGCVIDSSRYDADNFEHWWSHEGGNIAAVERMINHFHLWDVFEPEGTEEERALEVLADRMARSWELHAKQQFPDLVFDVAVTDDYGPTITLWTRDREPRHTRPQV